MIRNDGARSERGLAPGTAGLPRSVVYAIPTICGVLVFPLLWSAAKRDKNGVIRALELIAHILSAGAVYIFAWLWWVTATGIDSM